MEQKQIKFKDLSIWLKFAIVGGWIALILDGMAFAFGFLIGILGI